jgi:hypothetical protein
MPTERLTPDEMDVLTGACNILDVVKNDDWKECWSTWDQAIRDGLSEMLRAEYEARELAKAVSPSLESRWISVKDRMPEPGRDVLIFVLDDYDGHKNYQIVDCYDEQASPEEWDEVTHWMELPAAPPATETQPQRTNASTLDPDDDPHSNGLCTKHGPYNGRELRCPECRVATETAPQSQSINWADDHSLAEAHKRDCELMPCGHMRKQAIYYMPGGMGCLQCERDQARAALREKEAELATAKQELERLRGAIEKYARHTWRCDIQSGRCAHNYRECTCGFAESCPECVSKRAALTPDSTPPQKENKP